MKKRRNQGWVPFLLGLALLLGAWLLLKLIPDLLYFVSALID